LFAKGMTLELLKKQNEAIACYNRTIEIDPMYIHAWYRKGIALLGLGEHEEAIKCMDAALEIDPSFKIARVQKQIMEKGEKEELQEIQLDFSRIEETDEGFIYEDKEGKLWKLHFDKSDENEELGK